MALARQWNLRFLFLKVILFLEFCGPPRFCSKLGVDSN